MRLLEIQINHISMQLYCDAFLLDANQKLMFMSFWGNETVSLEFFARITIPNHEFGIRDIGFVEEENMPLQKNICVGDPKTLKKFVTKTTHSTIVGTQCHVFIFDERLLKPDRMNMQSIIYREPDESDPSYWDRVWREVKQTSRIGLLDDWKDVLLEWCIQKNWLTELQGFYLQGHQLLLIEKDFNQAVQNGLTEGALTIPPTLYTAPHKAVPETVKEAQSSGQLALLL